MRKIEGSFFSDPDRKTLGSENGGGGGLPMRMAASCLLLVFVAACAAGEFDPSVIDAGRLPIHDGNLFLGGHYEW